MQTVSFDQGEKEWVPNRRLIMTASVDIPGVVVALGLGGYSTPPVTWITAPNTAVLIETPTSKSIEAQLFLGDTIRPASGDWWLYMRLTLPSGEALVGQFKYERVRVINSGAINYP